MARSDWIRPELIVISRGKREESVLSGCKGGPGHTAFLSHHDSCHANAPECTLLCSSIGAS